MPLEENSSSSGTPLVELFDTDASIGIRNWYTHSACCGQLIEEIMVRILNQIIAELPCLLQYDLNLISTCKT